MRRSGNARLKAAPNLWIVPNTISSLSEHFLGEPGHPAPRSRLRHHKADDANLQQFDLDRPISAKKNPGRLILVNKEGKCGEICRKQCCMRRLRDILDLPASSWNVFRRTRHRQKSARFGNFPPIRRSMYIDAAHANRFAPEAEIRSRAKPGRRNGRRRKPRRFSDSATTTFDRCPGGGMAKQEGNCREDRKLMPRAGMNRRHRMGFYRFSSEIFEPGLLRRVTAEA